MQRRELQVRPVHDRRRNLLLRLRMSGRKLPVWAVHDGRRHLLLRFRVWRRRLPIRPVHDRWWHLLFRLRVPERNVPLRPLHPLIALDANPIVKVVLSAILLTLSAELAKRSTLAGAVILSLPLTSVLAMIWVYSDTHDVEKIADFSTATLWMVIPSLVLFIVLPILLRNGMSFGPAMGWSCAATAMAYGLTTLALRGLGVQV